MSNGRIEREPVRPGMYESWQDAARGLGSIVGAWLLLCWFVSWFARVGEVAGWEIAGLIAGLIAVSAMARRPGR